VEAYDGPQIVGMDLHRRRSVLVRMTPDGQKLATAPLPAGERDQTGCAAAGGQRQGRAGDLGLCC
jgi:hypothetical protein